jgi:glutamate synthase (ferredoxin)
MATFYWVLLGIGAFLVMVLLYDLIQGRRPVLRNFPLIGHLRYWLIQIGPELRQYIVAGNREERPFTRVEREWIEEAGDGKNNYFSFGTDDEINQRGFVFIKNAAVAYGDRNFIREGYYQDSVIPCAKVFGEWRGRRRTYRANSLINISGMSFGALSGRAVQALNLGAKQAGCYQSTGEGGLSDHHRQGGDLMFQIGTGYFGVQDAKGEFSMDRLVQLVEKNPQLKLIEVKMSQGAKPGKGGLLPGTKVTAEIAKIRGVAPGETCISPTKHNTFETPGQLIDWVEQIAEATGLPVGIKTAVGHTEWFEELAKEMNQSKRGPDFITIDGGEGGTGAAPLTFTDHVSLPFRIAFSRTYKIFLREGLADKIVWIGAGKLGFPDRAVVAFAMGCDLIHAARESLFGIGCIQAQKCHTNNCPTGITTHKKWLEKGIDPNFQAKRLVKYIHSFHNELAELTHAAGYGHPSQFKMGDIEISSGDGRTASLRELYEYDKIVPAAPPSIR